VGSLRSESYFVSVGVNLAVALCSTDTLAGVLLSLAPQVVSWRRGLMIDGVATLHWVGILYRSRAAPALRRRRHHRPCAGRRELSFAAQQGGAFDAGSFPPLADLCCREKPSPRDGRCEDRAPPADDARRRGSDSTFPHESSARAALVCSRRSDGVAYLRRRSGDKFFRWPPAFHSRRVEGLGG
jgi:hypothetical protein